MRTLPGVRPAHALKNQTREKRKTLGGIAMHRPNPRAGLVARRGNRKNTAAKINLAPDRRRSSENGSRACSWRRRPAGAGTLAQKRKIRAGNTSRTPWLARGIRWQEVGQGPNRGRATGSEWEELGPKNEYEKNRCQWNAQRND
jgi:hypothetical protein